MAISFNSHASSIILGIAYGIRTLAKNDPYIDSAERAMAYASDGSTPGRYLVDVLPWLKHVPAWFPGASFQRVAQEARKVVTASVTPPFEEVKKALVSRTLIEISILALMAGCKANGTATPSFTARCLEKIDLDGDISYQHLVIKNTAGTMFGGELARFLSAEHRLTGYNS